LALPVNTFVIASEAKQSMSQLAGTWIASAFALRASADTSSLSLLAMMSLASDSHVKQR
jgi:hypothetical protein